MARRRAKTPTAAWVGAGPTIYTIGHSTRSLQEFLGVLEGFRIEALADIRTIPRSRHNPQFEGDALARSLTRAGVQYVHLARLGGLRRTGKDSPNMGWQNASFRGFADYMASAEFERGLVELLALASQRRTAIMCAEAVPWRCHRSLVADALTARGIRVEHTTAAGRASAHRMTPFAEVQGLRVLYPAG